MLIRLIIPANFALGFVIFVAAFVLPMLYKHVYLPGEQESVEMAIAQIVSLQREELVERKRYVTFDRSVADLRTAFENVDLDEQLNSNFAYEAFFRPNGNLEIRAISKPEAVRDRWIPPLIYHCEMTSMGAVIGQEWVKLSGRSVGFLTFLRDLF